MDNVTADISILIGDHIADLVIGCLVYDHQIPEIEIWLHALPGYDNVRSLTPNLDGGQENPGRGQQCNPEGCHKGLVAAVVDGHSKNYKIKRTCQSGVPMTGSL
jgi:hypothetical protein